MFAQPAIFCASLASWAELGRPAAELMAGHSLASSARSWPRARSPKAMAWSWWRCADS